MFLEPENFGSGKPGRDSVAHRADRLFEPAEFFYNLVTLGRSRRITPELGGPNDLALRIDRHKAMLLPADPDRFDFSSHSLGLAQRPPYSTRRGIAPGVRMLLPGSWRQVRNQLVFLGCRGQHLAIACIDDQDLGGLRPAI